MRNIFRAPCGKFHMMDDGSPLQHECGSYTPPDDFSPTKKFYENPVPQRLHARMEDEEENESVSEKDFERLSSSPEFLRREVRSNPILEEDLRAMERDRKSFQPSRPASMDRRYSYVDDEPPSWRSYQPPPRPARSTNPSDCHCDCDHAHNPVADRRREKTFMERRCSILRARYQMANKGRGQDLSCNELERIEGPALDRMLRQSLNSVSPEKQQEILQRFPELEYLRSTPQVDSQRTYKANPVSVDAPYPSTSPSVTWRTRSLPMTDGMRSVLATLSIPAGYRHLSRLKKERNRRVSLSMIDFALQDLSNWKPSDSDSKKFSVALAKDLRGLRARWKEFATIHNEGLDDAPYPIDENRVNV